MASMFYSSTHLCSSPLTEPFPSDLSRPIANPDLYNVPVIRARICSPLRIRVLRRQFSPSNCGRVCRAAMAVSVESSKEALPPSLDSTSNPPPLFDGTTRLYISYICPFAQRTWIARNYKGLQDKIKLVPIDLQNRPAWYKEKVYPENKVPSLEHNNQVKGESLDLIKYIDSEFEGPSLLPDDPEKKKLAEELISYSDSFVNANFIAIPSKGDPETEVGAVYDKLEDALSKFDDGPFFVGQFSLVDITYAPFFERFQPFFAEVKNYDILKGRPRLALWLEELNKLDAYTETQRDPKELLASLKKKFGIN